MDARDQARLRAFVQNGSEDAFRQIVENYTGLVYSAAYRYLGDRHLAEDAVQSTFIVLARKAGKLEKRVMLGSWLYRTVSLVCGHMVRSEVRRRRRETVAAAATDLTGAIRGEVESAWALVQPYLDKALASLPTKAREALVAHFLQGKSTRELADEWGVRQNTVSVRINYGIARLRERLGAMGVKVSGAILLAILGAKTAEAVPAGLAVAAASTASAAAGGTAAAGPAALIADQVARLMLWAKVKAVAACAAATVAVGGLATVVLDTNNATAPPVPAPTAPVSAPAKVDPAHFHPGHYAILGAGYSPAAWRRLEHSPAELVGVCKFYEWRALEPAEGVYDFTPIEADLARAQSLGKRLWIEIRYSSGSLSEQPDTPAYMWTDPRYGGSSRYHGSYETRTAWQLCIWNELVQVRFANLFAALGARFNREPYLEGLTISRTGVGRTRKYGYTVDRLRRGYRVKALAIKRAFPDKIVLQQMNTAPFDLAEHAEWLAGQGIGVLSLVSGLEEELRPVYPLHRRYQHLVPTGGVVYWEHYHTVDRSAQRTNTVPVILKNSVDRVNPWYLFWAGREPFLSEQVFPLIRAQGPPPNVRAMRSAGGQIEDRG
ncbi:MAG: sigma-70 family RNA polymerase sigma factor [Kiritimatiellae bacterium]|nr:sigma-70 family RNA polymerase sigma factor [Kiritimatiellia bacterium]